jgi:hypothetical protein
MIVLLLPTTSRTYLGRYHNDLGEWEESIIVIPQLFAQDRAPLRETLSMVPTSRLWWATIAKALPFPFWQWHGSFEPIY